MIGVDESRYPEFDVMVAGGGMAGIAAAIAAEEAAGLGIAVERLLPDDDLRKHIWYPHCWYSVAFRAQGLHKVFESATVR